ncbi:MAG TPA: FtsQ-type POTRA domain-containing protein [Candidatus Latescibacteria bacterium]|nr:FtsQ-type POTRA domain-containing protein [Candidatus Latescibacterota bacterium]HOS64885.1 FtsQ-type POTRA domain-containing protein [Candidatus Latescibacterota bacterium]HPK75800.1 FtsQ-type POTRA domain-containing protein [Candidatus Latescibacterota bacterium]
MAEETPPTTSESGTGLRQRVWAGLITRKTRVFSRWPWIARLVAFVAYAATGAALWGTGYGIIRLPWLAIDDVVVVGTDQVDVRAIHDAAGIRRGSPLLALDVNAVTAGVKSVPWVRDVRVSRHLPGRVRVEVVERAPIAVFQLDRCYLMDEEGFVTPLNGRTVPDLPIVTGLKAVPFPQRESLEPAGRALAVVAEFPVLRNTVSELSLADSTRMVLILSPRGTPVSLPRLTGRDRLVMLASVIAYEPDLLMTASHLDARFLGHLAVTSSPSSNGNRM